MKLSKKILALLLAVMLIAGLTSGAWASALPLGPVMSNLEEVFADYDLTSSNALRVVVELHDQPSAHLEAAARDSGLRASAEDMSAWEARLLNAQHDVVAQAKMYGVRLSSLRNYTLVFNGVLVEVPANQVGLLSQISGVKAVWPDEHAWADLDVSVPVVRTPLSVGMPEGYDGTGVVVAVLDTGIDYTHPDLGAGFGPGFKVVGGWDFVDDDGDPMETKNMPGTDSGGRAFNTSHGTHVAATVAAVAPGAKILGIRVLGPTGSGSTADVMSGIEYAVRAGAHVANMSLGAAWGHAESPWARAVDNAVRAGVVFAVSNGNNGPNDSTTGTYAASRLAIAVGNADAAPKIMATAGGYSAVGSLMTFSPAFTSLYGTELEYVDALLGRTQDFVGRDVAGKVALVQRGEISFVLKSRNARDAGAIACIIFNNVSGNFAGTLGDSQPNDIPTMSVSLEDGNALRAVADKKVVFSVGAHHLMNSGSSRGPTQQLEIKPDVSAPGTNITAAYPFPGSDGSHVPGAWQKEPGGPWYGTISGTSMAAPHVAGGAAILLQANPTWTPEQVKLALMNTAQDIKWPHGISFRPVEQGAGMIDIARAVRPNLMVNPGALNFKEVTVGDTNQSVKLKSMSLTDVTYNVRLEKYIANHDYTVGLNPTVVVPASGEVDFALTLQVGANLPQSTINQNNYGGFIRFENAADPTDSYRIPFHFVNRQFISQVSVSPLYFSPNGDGIKDTATVTLVVGAPVNAIRVMAAADGFWRAIYLHTGPVAAGVYSFEWNGRTLDGFTAADGSHLLHAHYQLTSGGSWIGGYNTGTGSTSVAGVYGRVIIDRAAPTLHNVRPMVDVNKPGHIAVRGNVDDWSMIVMQQDGGAVYVNGAKAYMHSENDPRFPGSDWAAFLSQSMPVNVAAGGTFSVKAEDSAGNSTTTDYSFKALTVDNPAQETVVNATYRISGSVIPGMQLTVAGQPVSYNTFGQFAVDVPVGVGVNHIPVVASVPSWTGFAPITQTLAVHRTGFLLVGNKSRLITEETFVASIMAEAVTDLCGVEFEVTYDPALLEVVSVQQGAAFDNKDLFIAVNEAQNGVIRFAGALTKSQVGFTGTAPAVQITFKSKTSGQSNVTLVSAAGVNSAILPVTSVAAGQAPITGVGLGRIAGMIELPGRHSIVNGVVTPRFNGVNITWGDFQTTSSASGSYEVNITGGGTHTLTVRMPGWITETRTVTVNGDNKETVLDFVLISGDVNDDGQVSLADLVLFADAYGAKVGETRYRLSADINGDGTIDIFDLFAVTRNYSR